MPSASICLNCRNVYDSKNKLHRHIRGECWATAHERQYPGEWTPSLKRYVQRALDPANKRPGWSKADIISELKSMISVNSLMSACTSDWDWVDLPQDFNPANLPYERSPRPAALHPSSKAGDKYYPNAYTACITPHALFKHEVGELLVSHFDPLELLIYTDGACMNNGTYLLCQVHRCQSLQH